MKPMSKILIFLAVLIFSAVMVSECVNADNEIVLDDWKLGAYRSSSYWYYDFLLLEIDFTQGDSAFVEIDVYVVPQWPSNTTERMTVNLVRYLGERLDSQGTNPIFVIANPNFTARGAIRISWNFIMYSDEWQHGIYHILIYPTNWVKLNCVDIYLDVNFHVGIDYDGDGLYGSDDDQPYFNDTWISELETRLVGIRDLIAGNYIYLWTLISNLTTELNEFKDNTSVEFSILRTELEQEVSDLLAKLEFDRIVSMGQDADIQSFLTTLELQVYDVFDSMNETTMSLNLMMTELEFETGKVSDVLRESIVGIYNNLQILEAELGVRIDEVDSEVADIWYWNNESLNETIQLYNEDRQELAALEQKVINNNAANARDNQLSRQNLREVQEDIEDALDEAKAARMVGLITGLVGIILAIVAIIMVVRGESGDREVKED